ncbi:hypothetical protein [Legionella saoudiensis]|uniref:hypothetical protein n=1 Tax=Legionella saoudiensis TaxID=1750561 RepID=UPI00073146FD|nr:hypothetical protein [Legionella saoudiensis]
MSDGKLNEKISRLEQQVRSADDYYQGLAEEHRLLKIVIDKAPRKIIAMDRLINLYEQKINEARNNNRELEEVILEQNKLGVRNQRKDLIHHQAACEKLLPEVGAKLISARAKHSALVQELATAKNILQQKQGTSPTLFADKQQPSRNNQEQPERTEKATRQYNR